MAKHKIISKILNKHGNEKCKEWLQLAINFIKTYTDIELQEVQNHRYLQDNFIYGLKIKDGVLLYSKKYPPIVWDLLHEAGHLASITKKYRQFFGSKLELKIPRKTKKEKVFVEFVNDFHINPYFGDEEFAGYWSYVVAKVLKIDTRIFPYQLNGKFSQNYYKKIYYQCNIKKP